MPDLKMTKPNPLFSQTPLQVLKTSKLSSFPPHMRWRGSDQEGGLEPSAGSQSSWQVKVAAREVPCLQGHDSPKLAYLFLWLRLQEQPSISTAKEDS